MYRPYRENPSFSSSLLDEIYRSIDQRDDQEVTVFQKTTRNKQSSFCADDCETALFDKWAEPVTCKKGVTGKQSPPDFKTSYNSSSSSSDSSCGGGFSSSETESVYGFSSKPKPIRTTSDRHDKYSYSYNTREKDKQCNYKHNQKYEFDDFQAKPKHEGKFVKTKSRAMKIYGDLKKAKQPISPGGRLATFLNSIFATNNTKNTKIPQSLESKSANASTTTCSSASSYSRSCLSKTPSSSSREKLNTNMKRSVRFYLDTEPSYDIFAGLKQDYNKHDNKTRQVEEAARNLLRNYQKKVECEFELSSNNVKGYNVIDMKYENDDDDDDDDDDVASHASSDLFELENLSAIGMGKYGDELPVYETTHLDMNLAIGNGFLM